MSDTYLQTHLAFVFARFLSLNFEQRIMFFICINLSGGTIVQLNTDAIPPATYRARATQNGIFYGHNV